VEGTARTLATTPEKTTIGSGNTAGRGQIGGDGPALPQIRVFLRTFWRRIAAVSAVVMVPCFWHRRIVAEDLGSHLYNVWLAQLIDHGQVSAMCVANQWTNVLFDLMLAAVGKFASLHTAERVVVSITVLIFFWGAFAMVSAATRRAPWMLTPFIALVTYGWTFHTGIFNYYLSLGFAFFGIAIFWRGKRWEKLLPVVLLPLIVLAHPLGLVWMFAACAYIGLAELLWGVRVPGLPGVTGAWTWLLLVPAAALIYGIRYYLLHHFGIQDSLGSIVKYNGADQVVLFGERYYRIEAGVIVATLGMLGIETIRRLVKREPWALFLVPLQLYMVIEFAAQMLPSGVTLSNDLAAIAILTERLTSVAAVLALCVMGAMKPSRWHLAATAAIAGVFFVWVYQDTGVINRMEAQAEQLVRTLPRDSRVMATIFPLPDSRIWIQHMIDRACIGYCFDYGNYEPGTGLFRVRADEAGYYNMGDYGLAVDMEEGHYVVQPQDLPSYQVYQCTQSGTVLCVVPLVAGEENDAMGVYGRE
jgi:hypothetical protein